MSDKLCPFCGGSECYSVDDYGDVSVACLYKTHGDTWNTRPLEDAANARAEAAEARVHELQTALDAAINMNIEKNAKVVRLTAALREANEDGLDIATLEYAAKWIENSLAGETSDRVIEFGKSMAMSIRAAKPLVKICAECGGSGEVAGDYFSDDGMSTCARCNGVGHERYDDIKRWKNVTEARQENAEIAYWKKQACAAVKHMLEMTSFLRHIMTLGLLRGSPRLTTRALEILDGFEASDIEDSVTENEGR